ncbi:MAG: FAD-binding protein [Burkholderiales bacterium]|nr:FAD-binding protein [Burkholderiales bacterium]
MTTSAPITVHRRNVEAASKQLAPQLPEASLELARRLAASTQGEVLFDAASRARYATDASIYQIMPTGVFVPRTADDVATALDIARELKAPVLARGAGSSQCGQTVGPSLVVDCSKHLRGVLNVNAEARTAEVEPGLVLDHLNARLKPLGLWFPVDVSTSAQATLGGMAGNNSCGSRSIRYGNMVHNVQGARAWMADGRLLDFGPLDRLGNDAATIAGFVRQLALAHAHELDAHWPKVMRRVGGYNLDIFRPQNERPYTHDGSVNLAHLLVGSEGTLAFTRSLTLQLAPLPRAKVLGVVNFASFHTAMDSAQHIVTLGPSAVELVDRTMVDLARLNPAFKAVMESALVEPGAATPEALLLVEFSGEDAGELKRRLAGLVELMGDLGLPGSVVEMSDAPRQSALWEVRKAGLNIMMSLKGDGKPVSFIEDCAVPLEHLAAYTDALTEVFARHGTRGTWYAHASVGTLHVRPILDMRREGAIKMRAIAEEAAVLVRKFKGAYSGEHGDGLCRGEWVAWQFGPRLNDAIRAIKQHFDPAGLFAPNRIVDTPRMDDTSLMRYPPGYTALPLQTAYDWSAWNVQADAVTEATTAPGTGGDAAQGLAKALEMCNNNGHCRKFDAGTMCPSYRVTRDEQHLTRGRANTLRLALGGRIEGVAGFGHADAAIAAAMNSAPSSAAATAANSATGSTAGAAGAQGTTAAASPAHPRISPATQAFLASGGGSLRTSDAGTLALASAEVHAALDLCVSCKGCKRDCPTGVDMAKVKLEVLAQRAQVHGVSRRARLIARVPQIARRVSGVPGLPALLNLRNKLPVLARLGERLTGISARRSLPAWRSDTFWRTSSALGLVNREQALAAPKAVALLVDSFNGYFESENAVAAVKVLQAGGYAVHVASGTPAGGSTAEPLCCGRTLMAGGLADEAKAKARQMVDALEPLARRGITIVGLEPSCLFTLRDEFLAMGLGESAQVVAGQALMFEEFLAREAKAGRFAPVLKPATRPLLVHGHCHQKAFAAMSPVLEVLKLIPGAAPSLIESSCCGMAGSFGYEAEHVDVSLQMAELNLLPAVRAASAETVIVADGTSCRHQIADGAGRETLHVARVLQMHLL